MNCNLLKLLLTTLGLCAALAAERASAAAEGNNLPGVALPNGEQVLELAWSDAHTVCLLVQNDEGYALRDLDVRSGELIVLNVPPSFKRLRPSSQLSFHLAPDGSGLVALSSPSTPLQPSSLLVFKRSGARWESVEQRSIPANFWPKSAVWGAAGDLYLTARPYVNPEQPYSIGRLDTASGRFDGVVLKANLDLVEELVPLPARGALILRCWGIRGEYPQEPVVAVWDMVQPGGELLHSQARHLRLSALDASQAVLAGDDSDAPQAKERWVLQSQAQQLRRLEQGMAARSVQQQLTPDGRWLIVLTPGDGLSKQLQAGELYVAMQALETGRTLATAVPCSAFALSPDGVNVAALSGDGRMIYYYSLPNSSDGQASEG